MTTAEPAEAVHFTPEEEEVMLIASNELKTSANKQFSNKDYSSAISTYDKALAELPVYLDYELAVLQSNIAACHIQLKEWKEAIESAERGLDGLEKELPMPKPKKEKKQDTNNTKKAEAEKDADDKVIELDDEEDEVEVLKKLNLSDERKADILRIRTKLLLRRARAKVNLCDDQQSSVTAKVNEDETDPPQQKKAGILENGSQWGHLSSALADYQTLRGPEYFHNLDQSGQKTVIEMLKKLPARVEDAKKHEVDEMMGKLKQLGNGILKPFGLSTDMFKMTQDPITGGWSMNFDQGGKK